MQALLFPRSDSALLQWSQNVVDLITPAPADWGLVVGDVTSYTSLHDSFASALVDCVPPARSKTAVIIKDQARKDLKAQAQLLANKIYAAAPPVSVAMKTQIGMPPRRTPAPVPAPSTAPLIEVLSTDGWTVLIRLRDATGARRGRAVGCTGASVFSFVGASAPTNLSDWKFEGNVGRVVKISVPFDDSLPAGTKVWFTSLWFNGRKQSGPMSDAISANLPGGGVSATA